MLSQSLNLLIPLPHSRFHLQGFWTDEGSNCFVELTLVFNTQNKTLPFPLESPRIAFTRTYTPISPPLTPTPPCIGGASCAWDTRPFMSRKGMFTGQWVWETVFFRVNILTCITRCSRWTTRLAWRWTWRCAHAHNISACARAHTNSIPLHLYISPCVSKRESGAQWHSRSSWFTGR